MVRSEICNKIRLGLRENYIPIPKDAPTKQIKVKFTEDEKAWIKDRKAWLKENVQSLEPSQENIHE